MLPIIAYSLCTFAALASAIMLLRGYMRNGFRLLLWSSLCFWGLTISNFMIFIDLITLPDINLHPTRVGIGLASMMLLIFGLVWETRS